MWWQVGNGKQVNFWNDQWLEKGLVLSTLVEERVVESSINYKVLQFTIDNGEWNWNLLSDLPLHVKMLLEKRQVPYPMGIEDEIGWRWTTNGEFTIKSAYKALDETVDSNNLVWKNIWKWKGPQRVKLFLWLAAHEAFLCNSKRKRLGMSDTDVCPRCGSSGETPLHVLRDCYFAKGIWYPLVDQRKWLQFFSCNMTEWLQMALATNFSSYDSNGWNLCFGVSIWFLWKWRNGYVFNEEEILQEAPLATISRFMKEVVDAKSIRVQLTHM